MSSTSTDDLGEFMPARIAVQACLDDLRDAHEQGLILESGLAVEALTKAATALAQVVWGILCRRSPDDKVTDIVLYECGALHELATSILADCIRPTPGARLRSYWLRDRLEEYAPCVERALSFSAVRTALESALPVLQPNVSECSSGQRRHHT